MNSSPLLSELPAKKEETNNIRPPLPQFIENFDLQSIGDYYGEIVRKISKGSSFGEIKSNIYIASKIFSDSSSFLDETKFRREETAIAMTESDLLAVDYLLWDEVVQRNKELKKNFLSSIFAYIRNINSTVVRNSIVNQFKVTIWMLRVVLMKIKQSESFSRGTIVTDENQRVQDPKIYVVEEGALEVLKRVDQEIRNPYNPREVFHKDTHWVRLCLLERASIFGEEALMYPSGQETYEYRVKVTVVSTLMLNLVCPVGNIFTSTSLLANKIRSINNELSAKEADYRDISSQERAATANY